MFTNTYMQRGYVAIQSQDPAEARQWFEKAVAADPGDPQALACLGQSLCWLGLLNDGLRHLRAAGQLLLKKARKSHDIRLVLGMVEQLQHWNDYQGSVELSRQAIRINRQEVRAYQLLTLGHWRLNQIKPALDAGRQALRLAPGSATLNILVASLEAADKQYDAARRRLDRVLEGAASEEEQFRAHKELGRILDKVGEYPGVFPHLHAAAKLSASLPEVARQDASLVPKMLEISVREFDQALLNRWSGSDFGDDTPAPIFLLGFMRSGTTLTQEVLDAHPALFVADETDLIPSTAAELTKLAPSGASVPERLRSLDLDGIRQLRRFYWSKVRHRYGDSIGSRRLVDKTTMNTIDLGLIQTIFPDAHVIFVMRDPRDVCLSCYLQVMLPTPSTVHLFQWRETAAFYAKTLHWWLEVRGRMSMANTEIRYEDAVADFEGTFRGVFDFLGLPWDSGVTDFHRRAAGKYINSPSFSQVAQPLYDSSVGRWRHYAEEFECVDGLLRPFIDRFGYPQA